ncbi:MAG: Nucleotide binding protein PINc [Segetibacter sp.]|nr:Nucleotide binding protein PINc [Segetibacter sp.]
MNSLNTIVIDNNALISAVILKASVTAKAFNIAVSNFRIIYSFATLLEFQNVLFREKFDKYISYKDRIDFLNYFLIHFFEVQVTCSITACRDTKDNKFLELAVDGNAEYILTGDKDLLALHPFRNISIITPAEFLEKFSNQ